MMTTASAPLLTFEAVEALYDQAILALAGVSLTVPAGQVVALLGANGAGKSTTLKAASNLLPAERGRVRAGRLQFDGRDITRSAPDDLVRRGLVPVLEGRHCFRALTVEENLITGAVARGSSRAELRDDLNRIYQIFPRLQARRHSAAGLTSGGEQQMVAIGRALMSRPRLLLLDEPSMGLAPLIVAEIFATLRRLNQEEGLSILLAEQNAAVALAHADHAYVIENGRTVLDGPAADLRQRDDIKAFYLGATATADPVPAVARL